MCVREREGERDRDREKNRENDLWCSMGILISQWIAQMGSFLALAKLKNIRFEKKKRLLFGTGPSGPIGQIVGKKIILIDSNEGGKRTKKSGGMKKIARWQTQT